MNKKSHSNLKPWQPGQSGNPAGRKVGSRNVSTIIRELLEEDIDSAILSNPNVLLKADGKPKSYARGIAQAMCIKALEGNVQAARLVFEAIGLNSTSQVNQDGLFNTDKLVIEVVKSENQH
jgi:hypothetical protein